MFEQYKSLLSELVKFKSVSTDASFLSEIQATVGWYKKLFQDNGFTVQVVEGHDNPLIVADYVADSSLKTVLVYGHYDVQPASKEEGWDSEPFALSERNGRLYARGVIDNKGQHLVHVVNVFKHIHNKTLGYNIKFLIEGAEEIGSPNLERFIKENRKFLKADFVLLSDGEISGNMPNIEIGFRGIFNATLNIKVGNVDLHSGMYGGFAPNAIHELAKIISKFYTEDNRISEDELYLESAPITKEILENNKNIPFFQEEYEKITGKRKFFTENNLDFYTKTGLLPSIEVTGIQSGYAGEGYRNAIPHKALAKINVRLSPTQDPQRVFASFKKFLKKITPDYIDWDINCDQSGKGVFVEVDNEHVAGAKKILETVWQKPVALKYVGGSLPIITFFKDNLDLPTLSIPLVNEDCNMHGANENFELSYLEKAMEFSKIFFTKK